MKLALRVLVCCLLVFTVGVQVGLSQSRSGTILGRISDSSGGAVAGATVTITEQDTNSKRTLTADSEGRYEAPLLPIGKYRITVAFQGFKESVVTDVVLETQQTKELDITLYPASMTSEVRVNAGAVAVEVERTNATLGQVIHSEQVSELPLNGRDFVQLGTLAPGVTKGEAAFFNNRGISEVSIRGSVSLAVQGMRENANDWLLDGVDNNELTAGAVSILPSIDAIDEFKVLAFNYSAEYGSRGSATVLVSTKSGSNQFHGTAFEFLRNDVLDARNFFDGTQKGKYNQNQFGASFGGPIRKDKTFFFMDYQGERVRQGLTILSTVPTAAMRTGDFTESFPGAPAKAIYDPTTNHVDPVTGATVRNQFPGNKIPANRLDSIGVALVNLFPLPNVANTLAGNYLSLPIKTFGDDSFSTRVDHNFSQKDSLFGRFSFDAATQFYPSGLPDYGSGGTTPGTSSNTNFQTDARNLSVSETHVFSSNTINQATIGFNRVFNRFTVFGYGINKSQQLGIPNANLGDKTTSGLSNISLSGGFNALGARTFSPFQGGTNVYQYGDTLSHVHGSHSLKTGFMLRFMQMNTLGNTSLPGSFSFDNNYTAALTASGGFNSATGLSIASLLLGLPASAVHSNQFNGFVVGRRWHETRVFVQDDWKLKPNFTLNLGLAYDVTTPTTEAHGRQANFDPSTNSLIVGGTGGVNTDWKDFGPRVGLAWSPWGGTKTVIRAGYGIFYDVSAVGGAQGLWQNPPYSADGSYTANSLTIGNTLETGFPTLFTPPTLATYTGNLVIQQKNFVQGMIQQWNLNAQRQLPAGIVMTVAYAGTRGSHIQDKGFNTNTATPGPGVNPAARRPFPQYNNFNAVLSRGSLRYDSLQLHAEKQAGHGMYFLASYTWSRAYTNGLSQNLGSPKGVVFFPLNIYPNEDKALSDTNLTNDFTFSSVYQLPFGRNRKYLANSNAIVGAIVSDWELSGIERIRSGFPLFWSVASNQSGTAVGNRPNVTCDATLPGGQRTPNAFFNTSCFAAPTAGVMGNAARSMFYGPGQVNTDFSVMRIIPLSALRERTDLQFRAEFFNIFNKAQFDQPGTVFGNANFGKIINTVNNSRQIQFALKLRF